jgi:hypothetical protein
MMFLQRVVVVVVVVFLLDLCFLSFVEHDFSPEKGRYGARYGFFIFSKNPLSSRAKSLNRAFGDEFH